MYDHSIEALPGHAHALFDNVTVDREVGADLVHDLPSCFGDAIVDLGRALGAAGKDVWRDALSDFAGAVSGVVVDDDDFYTTAVSLGLDGAQTGFNELSRVLGIEIKIGRAHV